MKNERQRIESGKITILISVIAIVSKICGFLRDAVLAHYYGSSSISDVFITTLSMPDIFFELIANSVAIGFVPIAIKMLEGQSKERINYFCSNVISVFETFAIVFTIVFLVFAKRIVYLLAPGFQGENADLAVLFLRVISFGMLFRTVSSVVGAYMQTTGRFIPVSMYGIIMDAVIIIFILVSVRINAALLPYGVLFGVFVQMLFALICAKDIGFRYRFSFHVNDPNLKAMLIMFLPALAATGANQVVQLVNKGMATTIMEGGVTLISNANKLGYAVENVIALSVAAVMYPSLSAYAVEGNISGFKQELLRGLNNIMIIMIPLSAALALYSTPIMSVLFGHGKYVDSVEYTSTLMKVYCIGIVGLSLYAILVRALYAQKMVKQSAFCALISLLVNITLCLILSQKVELGLIGIAMATAITNTILPCLAFLILQAKVGGIAIKGIRNVSIKAVVSCVPMLLFSYGTFTLFCKISNIFALLLCALVGIVSYFYCMYLFNVEEVKALVLQIKAKVLH